MVHHPVAADGGGAAGDTAGAAGRSNMRRLVCSSSPGAIQPRRRGRRTGGTVYTFTAGSTGNAGMRDGPALFYGNMGEAGFAPPGSTAGGECDRHSGAARGGVAEH